MRITHGMLTRNYLGRMSTNYGNLVKSNDKMSSQRAYNKGWENVSDAGKALKTRKLIADAERNLTTIRDAQGRAEAAEEALRGVNSLLTHVEDRVVQGLNGTLTEEDRGKIATELEKVQDEVFQIMNVQFSGKYVFAASGNADGSAPFSKDTDGSLLYQGQRVDDIVTNPNTGNLGLYDPAINDYVDIKYNKDNYVDIGYGYRLGSDGKIDPNTAFKDTYSGLECFGYGSANGTSGNVYGLLGDMVENLRSDNMDLLGDNLDTIPSTMNYLLTSITEVGTGVNTLENTSGRIEAELVYLYERQNDLEGLDLAEEIIYNKTYEQSWLVTIQMGSKLLPQSIFDFIR